MIEEYVPQERLFLAWNGDYYKPDLPYLDGIEIFIAPERATRLAAFHAGRTDFFGLNFSDGLTLDEEQQVVADDNAALFAGPGRVSALWFDTQSELFNDERVRRAVAMAIEPKRMGVALYGEIGVAQFPVPSLYFPEWAHSQEVVDEVLAFNLELAKQLMAEAGYPDGFETVLYTTGANLQAAEAVAGFLDLLGIAVKIEMVGFGDFLPRVLGDEGYNGMFLFRMPGVSIDIDTFLSTTYGADGIRNYSRLSDPVIEELIQAQHQEMDPERRKAIIHRLDQYIAERAYVVPLPGTRLVQAHSNRVQDFALQPGPDMGATLERVWLGEETKITLVPQVGPEVFRHDMSGPVSGLTRGEYIGGEFVLRAPTDHTVLEFYDSMLLPTGFSAEVDLRLSGQGRRRAGLASVNEEAGVVYLIAIDMNNNQLQVWQGPWESGNFNQTTRIFAADISGVVQQQEEGNHLQIIMDEAELWVLLNGVLLGRTTVVQGLAGSKPGFHVSGFGDDVITAFFDNFVLSSLLPATAMPTPMSNISVFANFSEPLDERAWRLVGSARHDAFSGAVVLTEPVNDQVGYLFSGEPINTEFFKTAFSFEIGGGSGANGFAFVVSKSIPTEADLSNVIAGGDFGAGALDGFGIEFDTFQNGPLDTSGNHVGVTRYPDMTALTAVDFGHNLGENGVYNATIIFESGHVQVYLDNPSIGLDQTLVLEYSIPGFIPFDGYFGFVGATGGSTDAHLIFDVGFGGVAAAGAVVPVPTATAALAPATLVVELQELNASGQAGQAILTARGDQTEVVVELPPGVMESELIHIHSGSCVTNLGGVAYGLNSIVDGFSGTVVNASLASLLTGDFAINAHQKGSPAVYTACGNVSRSFIIAAPTPTPTSLPIPGPGGIINESGSVGGVHWGRGWIAEGDRFDFGTGTHYYSQRNNTGGYFYSAQGSQPPQTSIADTVLFAKVRSSSICASGTPGYLGVTSGQLASLEQLPYSAHHSIAFWSAQYDECYDGLLLAFRQGDLYGLIEPISVDPNGSLQFNWWYGEPGVTNFTIALETARVPVVTPTPTPTPVPGFLPTPVQIAPPHGSVFNHFPRDMKLQWESVSWPRPLTYVVEIDCFHCCVSGQWCTDVERVYFEDPTTATSLEHSWVGAQPGRWRVWWVDDLGNESPKSDWWNFEFTV